MNKRKITWEKNLENKKMKMLSSENTTSVTHITVVEKLSKDLVTPTGGRKFNYQLTDKTAKANLLKAATRNCFEIEAKQKSSNLRFSAGSYLYVVMPMVKIWQTKYEKNETFQEGSLSVKVEEIENGLEMNARHLDTKIVFSVNNKKVVLHCYNSTQNLMVNGKMYVEFIDQYLQPLFVKEIETIRFKIAEYDKTVVSSLAPKQRPLHATKSLKGIRSIIHQPSFSCQKCSFSANNQSHLKRHKNMDHTKSFNKSDSTSSKFVKQSTRNNSLSEEMLICENLTIENTLNCIEFQGLQVNPPEERIVEENNIEIVHESTVTHANILCKKCKLTCNDIEELDNHMEEKHGKNNHKQNIQKDQSKSFDNDSNIIELTCRTCEFEGKTEDDMKEHKTKKCGFNCDRCEHVASSRGELKQHKQTIHDTVRIEINQPDNIISCNTCGYKCKLNIQMRKHNEKMHATQDLTKEKFKCNHCDFII